MKLESFSTILSDCTSKYNKIKKEDYLLEGHFPIIDQGQKFIGGYTDDGALIAEIEKELIIFGDHTKTLKFIDFPIAIGADGVKVLHVNKQKADPRYIYYFLKSVKLTDAGYSRHFKFLKEIKIPLPDNIDDQIKIARLLNHVESLITQRKESITLLDELLKSTFFEMFGSVLNNIKKYDVVKIEEISTAIKDGPHTSPKYVDKGIPILSTRNIRPGKVSFDDVKYVSFETYTFLTRNFKPSKNDVIVTKGGTTGFAKVVDFDFPFCIWVHLAIIRPNNKIHPIYLEHFINSDYGYFQTQKFTRGIANRDLGLTRIAKIELLLPPIDLQNQFATIVEKVDSLKIQYEFSLKELENMLGTLSQKAFNGDLIVNEDNIKKKNEEVMEEDNLDQYSKSIHLKKEKVDITNMSFAEYLDFPEELQIKHEKWMFTFLGEDEFYQFLLKDNFKNTSFTLGDLEKKFHNFFYHGGDMDFDNDKWKKIIFKFLEANPPLIEQYFDKESATIKLKLTDEAFKA